MGLLAHQVVPLRGEPHGKHVVGPQSGFVPCRSEGGMHAHHVLVAKHFHPGKAVRIGPHRIVDAREIGVDAAAPLAQKVRQKKAQLMVGEGPLRG